MMSTDYSVLMAVHKSENPLHFKTAIDSMLNQDLPPSDFVIVCDGPLTNELNKVLDDVSTTHPTLFNIIRLDQNQGLGNALNIGLVKCKYNNVLRMDSDDISVKERAKCEVAALNDGFDIVGGHIIEFKDDDVNKTINIRKVPLEQRDIYKFLKKRSPFNHPSVAYKRDFIISCGNYSNLRKAQDWELWVRCLSKGARVKNFDQVFVYMRSGTKMRKRRSGKVYLDCIFTILQEMFDLKLITKREHRRLRFSYRCYSAMPIWFKSFVTKVFLRK